MVSAFATDTRLLLGQEAAFEKSNEIDAIPVSHLGRGHLCNWEFNVENGSAGLIGPGR